MSFGKFEILQDGETNIFCCTLFVTFCYPGSSLTLEKREKKLRVQKVVAE